MKNQTQRKKLSSLIFLWQLFTYMTTHGMLTSHDQSAVGSKWRVAGQKIKPPERNEKNNTTRSISES